MRQLSVITEVFYVCGMIGFIGSAVIILPEYRHPSHLQPPYTAPIVYALGYITCSDIHSLNSLERQPEDQDRSA